MTEKQWTVRFKDKALDETITCDRIDWPSQQAANPYIAFFRDGDMVAAVPMENVLCVVTHQ